MLGFRKSIKRELTRMVSSPLYLVMMLIVPLGCALFFVSLMDTGLPMRTPVAVVDLDRSQLSRQVIRSLDAGEMVDIQYKLESYTAAMQHVRNGDIFGFFIIPADFEKDATAGLTPTLTYYNNMTYFVPGTLSFKGFKTVAVSTAGGLASTKLSYIGATPAQVSSLVQPVVIDSHPIGNPWLNYCYYLAPSFTMATVALLIMLFTVYTITVEIKHGTSVDWLEKANGHMYVALAGKLLPQSVIWILVMLAVESLHYGILHFPMNGSLGWYVLASVLFVFANQALATFIASVLPNPRLALSIVSLVGILTFSFAGFSFPVESMYGAIGVFSYIVPVRYLFLIYINNALNGFDVYYVRWCYVALLLFPYLIFLFTWRLKRACARPVYVP